MSVATTRWKETTLGAVGKWGSGGTPKSTEPSYYDGDIPWIRSGDLPDGPIVLHLAAITAAGRDNSAAKWVPANAVLIALYGATIGKLGITTYPVTTNQAVAYCIPDSDKTSSDYLFWYLLYVRPELVALGQGGAQPNISQTILKKYHLPLPSIDTQRRIVAKLDGLFSRSRNARKNLNRIPRLVERYKQAILAAAFRGELTAAYRQGRSTKGHQTLVDEAVRRRSAYFKKAGIKENLAALPTWTPPIKLPPGWGWASVDQLATVVQYGTSAKASESLVEGVPVLRMGNIADGYLDYHKLKYLPLSHEEFPDLLLQDGDILFNRTNSAELVGKTAVYFDTGSATSLASYLIRIRIVGYLPELLSAYINSEYGREWVRSVVNQQVGQANVNGTKLKELGVPLIPMEEQKQLWSCIKKSFAAIDRLGNETSRARELLDRLDQATLAKAFRGGLLEPHETGEAEMVVSQ
jgi:type I restriction enzyme S subunit